MKFSTVLLSLGAVSAAMAAPMNDGKKSDYKSYEISSFPFHFTSTYYANAYPDQVVNNSNVYIPGEKGAVGYYSFGINSKEDVICFNITLLGVTGAYQSPAKTATHVHEAPKGRAGPPRIAFPNPTGDGYKRTSYGCLQGPFTTGILANGVDTGSGFKVSQIEANPSGFFADVHTTKFVAGAVRGQLEKLEKKW